MATRSFFPSHKLQTDKSEVGLVPKCGACGLYKTCKSQKMKVSGKGKKGIYIIGEAPGADEDANGLQFVGPHGRELQSALSRHGIDLREDCWLDNALACRPVGSKIPDDKEAKWVNACQPHLINNIRQLKPHLILPFGRTAIRGLAEGFLLQESGMQWAMAMWAGLEIPCQKLNAWVVPNYHPSYLLYERDRLRRTETVVDLFFNRILKAGLKHKEVPWKEVPDFAEQVECILDTEEAVKTIRYFRDKPLISFDYETTCLKPDDPEVRKIFCCSMSDGKRTIAYPWNKQTLQATKKILRDPEVKKIGANIKFETAWSLAAHGIRVRGWACDVLLDQHILDCRRGITGVKFQGFMGLGQPAWNTTIEPYLKAKTGNSRNRIHLANLVDVLTYCGVDSIIEFWRGIALMRQVGLEIPGGLPNYLDKYKNGDW